MKKLLLLIPSLIFGVLIALNAQSLKLEVPIIQTGTIIDGEDTLAVSTDDAEQENDAIDALDDDDLDAGWEGDEGKSNILTMGLRFQKIYIPQGATVDSAFIKVWSHEGKSAEDVAKLTIYAEAIDDAVTFDTTNLITDRTSTTATVDWEVAEEWIIWEPYSTPDLSTVVQEIVDRDGWDSGNSIAFILAGENQGASIVENAREMEAFENISDPEDTDPDGNPGDGQNHPERVPRLTIYYTPQINMIEVPIVQTGTIIDGDDTLSVSTDDAEQENDAIDALDDDDLDAGWEGDEGKSNILTMGLRFQNIQIPQGATIDSSFVKVWSHEGKSAEDVAKLTIYAEATDDAATFDTTNLITDRTSTTATVDWEVAEEWIIWEPYRTPDLSTIVQEIVDRDGWSSGNSIAFIIAGENQGASIVENAREMEAFENISDPEDTDPDGNPGDGQNHPERVPRLFVYFSDGTTGVSTFTANNVESLKVYPNPVNTGIVNVEFETSETANITMFDLAGKSVYSTTSNAKKAILDLSHVVPGVYVLKAIQNGNIFINKISIK